MKLLDPNCRQPRTTNQRGRRFVSRWICWGGVVAIALMTAIGLALTRSSPLPPPKVELHFLRYATNGGVTGAVLSLTNVGPVKVCVWDSIQLWQAEVETPLGETNYSNVFATIAGEPVAPSSNYLIGVPLPPDALRWRITTTYGYDERRHIPSELHSWVWRSWLVQGSPKFVSDTVDWLLDFLPDAPPVAHGTVSSGYIANHPPTFTNPPAPGVQSGFPHALPRSPSQKR